MQFDASDFMRNISLLHLEGAEWGEGTSIKMSDTTEIISHCWESPVSVIEQDLYLLAKIQQSFFCSTASQQGQPVDNQILSVLLFQTGSDKSSCL